jgi:PAS domain S-box-containing protein
VDASIAVKFVTDNQVVLDSLPRAITIVDLDGTIIGWNSVAETLYGWSAAEAIGQSIHTLLAPPEVRQVGMSIMQTVFDGQRWSGRVMVLRRDATLFRTVSYLGPLRDRDGSIIGAVGVADDDIDVQLLEQNSSDLADHLTLALAAGQLGTWRWDMATGLTVWDAQMERLFGLQPGTFDGTYEAWVALLHPDDVHHSLGVVDQAVADSGSYAVEHRVVWPDGSEHWLQGRGKTIIDESGNVVGTIGCSIDVTERKLEEVRSLKRVEDAERTAARERRQRERMEFLVALNDVAVTASDHVELMKRVAAAAVPRLGDWCAVHFRSEVSGVHERQFAHSDPSRQQWAKTIADEIPFDPDARFGVARVMRTGRTEHVGRIRAADVESLLDSTQTESDVLRPIVEALHLTSVVTVPLVSKRGIVGAMQFVSAESAHEYDSDDVALAEAAAGRVAEALDNAWLVEQQRTIAVTLQAALLPAALPEIPGVSIAVRYWAAGAVSEVGGDFYDVFPIGDRQWAIVIGDVCGTGPKAAAVTATARHTIRAAAVHGASHAAVMHWVNDAVRSSGSGLFCTVAYSTVEQLDDDTWMLTSIAGGHPLPVLVSPDGGVRMLGVPGTLIGIFPNISVTPTMTALESGATVVLHTDGVNDVRPPHDLDDQALMSMIRTAASDGPADVIAERLGHAISDVLSIPERDDDVAVVVLRID